MSDTDQTSWMRWAIKAPGSWLLNDDPEPFERPRRRSLTEYGLRKPDRSRATVYAGELDAHAPDGRDYLFMIGGRRV